MILPLLPFYAQEFHATPLQIGLLFSSYSLTQLLFAPLLGRLSDRVGRRPVLLASIAGSVVCLRALRPRPLLSPCCCSPARSPGWPRPTTPSPRPTWPTSPRRRSARRRWGWSGAAFGLGFVLGPALGGVLAQPAASCRPRQLGPRLVPFAAAALSAVNLADRLRRACRSRSRPSCGAARPPAAAPGSGSRTCGRSGATPRCAG